MDVNDLKSLFAEVSTRMNTAIEHVRPDVSGDEQERLFVHRAVEVLLAVIAVHVLGKTPAVRVALAGLGVFLATRSPRPPTHTRMCTRSTATAASS